MNPRVLIAGVGNVFCGDDGFGVEVVKRLAQAPTFPDGVEVSDFGIRGVHLAYQLLNGYDVLVLIDATRRGELPGTISVIEADVASLSESELEDFALSGGAIVDGHGFDPGSVLALLGSMGGSIERVLVVGCEPEFIGEKMGLSEPIEKAIDPAINAVRQIIGELFEETTQSVGTR